MSDGGHRLPHFLVHTDGLLVGGRFRGGSRGATAFGRGDRGSPTRESLSRARRAPAPWTRGKRTRRPRSSAASMRAMQGRRAEARRRGSPPQRRAPTARRRTRRRPRAPRGRARVFVTSSTYDGNLGGSPAPIRRASGGADAKIARWDLSRMAQRTGRRPPLRTSISRRMGNTWPWIGTVVASSLAALLSGSLEHAIDLTETGSAPAGGATEVWTGIDAGRAPWATGLLRRRRRSRLGVERLGLRDAAGGAPGGRGRDVVGGVPSTVRPDERALVLLRSVQLRALAGASSRARRAHGGMC